MAIAKVLEKLMTEDFVASLGLVTTAPGLQRALSKSEDVSKVYRALLDGEITEASIGRFVDRLMEDFERGKQFPHEPALAAIALVLADRHSEFADEFLGDLARLNIVEMTLAPLVASESQKRRHKRPKSKYLSVTMRDTRVGVLEDIWKMDLIGNEGAPARGMYSDSQRDYYA